MYPEDKRPRRICESARTTGENGLKRSCIWAFETVGACPRSRAVRGTGNFPEETSERSPKGVPRPAVWKMNSVHRPKHEAKREEREGQSTTLHLDRPASMNLRCARDNNGIGSNSLNEVLEPMAKNRTPVLSPERRGNLYEEIQQLHRSVDEKTALLREMLGPEAELVRRAEEAGAALHRLEWALERFDIPTATGSS
jgi:hypothetical protein